jgi:hypothetical protein
MIYLSLDFTKYLSNILAKHQLILIFEYKFNFCNKPVVLLTKNEIKFKFKSLEM